MKNILGILLLFIMGCATAQNPVTVKEGAFNGYALRITFDNAPPTTFVDYRIDADGGMTVVGSGGDPSLDYDFDSVSFSGTGGLIIHRGTTAQRLDGPNGTIRYNTTTDKFEAYEGGSWEELISSQITLSNGEGTTANGTSVDLGGEFSSDVLITSTTGNTFSISTSLSDDKTEFFANEIGGYFRYRNSGSSKINSVSFDLSKAQIASSETGVYASIIKTDSDGINLYYQNPNALSQKMLEFTDSEMLVTDTDNNTGLVYASNYSSVGKLNDLWVPNYGAVKSQIGGQDVDDLVITPTETEDGYILSWDDGNSGYELIDISEISGTANDAQISESNVTQHEAALSVANTQVTGLGTMSTQNSSSVSVTGGTLTGVSVNGVALTNSGSATSLLNEQGNYINIPGTDTGIEFGGAVTPNIGDANTMDISDGQGTIYDDTDPENPVLTTVSWTGITNISLSTNDVLVFFYFDDNSNTLKQTTVTPTIETHRTRLYIGSALSDGVTILGIVKYRDFTANIPTQLREVALAIGLARIEGLIITANGANLNIDRSAGILFDYGSNDYSDPHSSTFTSNIAAGIFPVDRNDIMAEVTVIDPDNYDLNGVLTAVPNNRFTIQDLFFFSNNTIMAQYGQTYYNTAADAFDAISTRTYVPNPATLFGLRVAYLIVQEGTTDLTTSAFFKTNRFGELGGGAASPAVVGDVTAAVDFGTDNSLILSDGTGKGVKTASSTQLTWTTNSLQVGVSAGNTQTNYEDSGVIINLTSSLDKGRLERITSPISSQANVFTLSGKSTANTTKEAILIDGSTNQDSGVNPVTIITSRKESAVLANRPTLAGYNYNTKQWEVGADGNWDYQGNDIEGVNTAAVDNNIILSSGATSTNLLYVTGNSLTSGDVSTFRNLSNTHTGKVVTAYQGSASSISTALYVRTDGTGNIAEFNNDNVDVAILENTGDWDYTGKNLTNIGQIEVATQTPASAGATGTAGTITWDANYIYICTATDTWKRVAIATW